MQNVEICRSIESLVPGDFVAAIGKGNFRRSVNHDKPVAVDLALPPMVNHGKPCSVYRMDGGWN